MADQVQDLNVQLGKKLRELVKYTREMRRLQKAYFKQRLQGDLVASKEAEKVVDKLLDDIDRLSREREDAKRRARQAEFFKGGG